MLIIKAAATLTHFLQQTKSDGALIGFVPTMGALHEGHIALIEAAKQENTVTVCSIFVNPTQFNNHEDFNKYPIDIESDIEKLIGANTDVLFLPTVAEIYPAGFTASHYNLGYLETVLEGAFRPGHFQGVAQVVDRLLTIARPHRLYLGEKDLQQCAVIKKLLHLQKDGTTELKIVSTVRESSGLAMSSRNRRLDAEALKNATALYKALQHIKANRQRENTATLISEAKAMLTSAGFTVDYVSVVNSETLLPLQNENEPAVALAAAAINNVRLIDNLRL